MSGPPELSDDIKLPEDSNIPGLKEATQLASANNVVDFLLLTVVDCEFRACYFYLQNPSVYTSESLGLVYIGKMGAGNEEEKLKVALIKCDMGSAGAATAVNNAVTTLTPKAVFCVGFCGGMNAEKAKLGDVVVSSTLISYELAKITKDDIQRRGPSVRLEKFLNNLMKYVSYGWKAPVKNKEEAGKVVTGAMLSGDKLLNASKEKEKFLKEYSHAIAIEMEGAGKLSCYFYEHNQCCLSFVCKSVVTFHLRSSFKDFQFRNSSAVKCKLVKLHFKQFFSLSSSSVSN